MQFKEQIHSGKWNNVSSNVLCNKLSLLGATERQEQQSPIPKSQSGCGVERQGTHSLTTELQLGPFLLQRQVMSSNVTQHHCADISGMKSGFMSP